MNNVVDWEKKARADMIANRRVVGLGLMPHPSVSASVRNPRGRHSEQAVPGYVARRGKVQATVSAERCAAKVGIEQRLNTGSREEIRRKGAGGSSTTGPGGTHIGSVAPGMETSSPWWSFGSDRAKKRRVQCLGAIDIAEKKREERHDIWFNQVKFMHRPREFGGKGDQLGKEKGTNVLSTLLDLCTT